MSAQLEKGGVPIPSADARKGLMTTTSRGLLLLDPTEAWTRTNTCNNYLLHPPGVSFRMDVHVGKGPRVGQLQWNLYTFLANGNYKFVPRLRLPLLSLTVTSDARF